METSRAGDILSKNRITSDPKKIQLYSSLIIMFLPASLFLLLFTFIILLVRLKGQMAALVAWIVGTIAGSNSEEKDQEIADQESNDLNNPKSKKGRQKSKKCSTKEPTFNTSLTTPIEKVIEETLNEENNTNKLNSKSPVKPRRRNKTSKSKSKRPEDVEDEVGFSFFRGANKSLHNVEKQPKKLVTKASPEKPNIKTLPLEDPLGFSFLPVKKSTRKYQTPKIDNLPKSSLLEHYQPKTIKKTSPNEFGVVEKLEEVKQWKQLQPNLIEIVNKGTGKVVYLEAKESKKVHSKISYASVTSQNYEESLARLKKEEQESTSSIKIEIPGNEGEVEYSQSIVQKLNQKLCFLPLKDSSNKEIRKQREENKRYIVVETDNDESSNSKVVSKSKFDQSEELVSEIESEERRLVNLIEDKNELAEEKEETLNDFTQKLNISQNSCIVENTVDVISSGLEENIFTYGEERLKPSESSLVEQFLIQDASIDATVSKENIVYTTESSPVADAVGVNNIQTSISNGNEDKLEITESFSPGEDLKVFRNTPVLEEKQEIPYVRNIFSPVQVTTRVVKGSDEEKLETIKSSCSGLLKDQHIAVTIKQNKEQIKGSTTKITESKEAGETITEPVIEELVLKQPKMSSGVQVRILTLNDKEHQDSTLYRIEKNWIIQFRLGPSLLGRKVSLYCNYPRDGQEFDRNLYNLLEWNQEEGCIYSDDTALLTEITSTISGSFHYYFTYSNGVSDKHQGSGFFIVDPVLKYGNNEEVPLDCIQCQTVLAKHLGPFDTWENKLRVAKESGYNMIHFTPIQELGASNSSYSLSEQLKVNPVFNKQNDEKTTFEDVEKLVSKIRSEWKMLSICDIVLNHTANESKWLKEHPEVTYNCLNCPYMRPSYLLDAALHHFSLNVAKGLYEDKGIPPQVSKEDHLCSIRYHLHTDVLSKINIHEMYICDVSRYLVEFLNLARKVAPSAQEVDDSNNDELELIQDPFFRRFASTIDINLALKRYNVYRHDCFDEETRIKRCAEDFKNKLDFLNRKAINVINEHLHIAVENIIAGIRYFRVQHDGPKIRQVSVENPLVSRYFTDFGEPKSMEEHEEIMYGEDGKFLMAHNGWVMNSDPLRNFAAPESNVYIRRELIAWGDSVKLRFGEKIEDCPFLWNHMRAYVEQTARIFDGVRLDNCHSTPIPVAEYLLDCARKVRPDLYVVAELFTNSDLTDNIFVNRLGITSLIREAMSAWDSHEQGRLVYRYGGSPVGSFYQPKIRPLIPSIAHALFLDLTHDNPSPVEKRSIFDLLPSTALVNMACCASGSNRGYDEFVPHHIHVVDETRQYTEWTDDDNLAMGSSRYVTKKSGIIAAKKALNDLHFFLGSEGFNQVYVDQMDSDIVAVTRHCPETHQSYVMVVFTAFTHPPEDSTSCQRPIKPLRVEGVLDEIVLEATLTHTNSQSSNYGKYQNFHKDSKWINGLTEYRVHLTQHIQPGDSVIFDKVDSGASNVVQLNFKNFKPGSVAVIKVSLPEDMREAVNSVRKLSNQFSFSKETELWKIINDMTLSDLNRALFRCDQEERDEGYGFDTYNIPNYGPLVYAGLQGFMSVLCNIRSNNDLGHPMCTNLRDGNWIIDYIWQRFKLDESTGKLGQWFEENTKSLKLIPRYLVPCYFDMVVTGVYVLLIEQSYNLMSEFVKRGSAFVKGLAMGSLQFSAYIKSADLPILSPNLSEPKPPQTRNGNGEIVQACVTLSAGLPHFAVGYMRNWGRDTFIALRGLFLLTGRYQDARYHILGYGACLRHGLIPNLLDGGRNSRFNCRDAVWWWLYCIKCYVEDVPGGTSILSDKVSRIFPKDDSPAQSAGTVDQPLHQVMQEALNVHFQGLTFRERNAGKQIDEQMTDKGFNNQIGVHPETGFVFGGNSFNCGTWMDKMGSSDKAGNRGKPATPRDGSAIELIGLSKAVVSWLDRLHKNDNYPYEGVQRTHKNGSVTKWSFKEWADKIQSNFEKCFWINTVPHQADEISQNLINKRGIYKDCHGASQEWTDFQLRCNFPIAMVVAPELFNPRHAWIALQQAEKYLLGPLGMKTLDPEDWAYNGNYDNSNDSDNHHVAHGFNYHQGPEWIWPLGFYLRAKLQFSDSNGELEKTLASTKIILSKHFVELQTSTWRGLPELTNENGAYCKDSSRTQAWSMSSILEVLNDLQKVEKHKLLIN